MCGSGCGILVCVYMCVSTWMVCGVCVVCEYFVNVYCVCVGCVWACRLLVLGSVCSV